MSEVTIPGLAEWLKRVERLSDRAEAANDKYRGKTGEEAYELLDEETE